jgi:hypothetical protein
MVVIFSGPYMSKEANQEKFYAMLVAMVGVMIGLGCAYDLFNLWIWFEAMAITSYLLVAFYRELPLSLEAGVKYLLQSAAGSVLVLLGISLVLAQTGTLDLSEIRQAETQQWPPGAPIGLGKTALVPMHTKRQSTLDGTQWNKRHAFWRGDRGRINCHATLAGRPGRCDSLVGSVPDDFWCSQHDDW